MRIVHNSYARTHQEPLKKEGHFLVKEDTFSDEQNEKILLEFNQDYAKIVEYENMIETVRSINQDKKILLREIKDDFDLYIKEKHPEYLF